MVLLDREACDRARLSRDRRFDGQFFTGVLTTRVYCRPVCPVRPARSQHVRFYPSAAAAERAGFRPCLRCCPEAAPGTPAWEGSAVVVSRALEMIEAGFLDQWSVAELAASVLVGERQLTRLFARYLGASPLRVAQTRRIQMAKRLLSETDLPVTEIAFAAGFTSLRRFNAAVSATYGRAPSRLRRAGARAGPGINLRLAYRPPLDWPVLAALLAAEATPLVEQVTPTSFRRTAGGGWLDIRPDARQSVVSVSLVLPEYSGLRGVTARIRRLLDLDLDPVRTGVAGVRLAGVWDGFELALRALLSTEVLTALIHTYGHRLDAPPAGGPAWVFPHPSRLLGLPEPVGSLAEAVVSGTIHFDASMPFSLLADRLTSLAGLPPHRAAWVAMRSLGEPDAPLADPIHRPWRSYTAIAEAMRGPSGRG